MKTDRNLKLNTLSMAIAAILSGAATDTHATGTVAASGGPGPVMTTAANGVPVVNIVAPNSNGLSHNRYNEFNVDKQGLILNNATEAGLSQLGGAVAANANLGGKSASIILNEVVGTNRSALNGFIEVNGKAAEVILANPYGITCNGCGFINTPRATLITGTPNVDGSGNLSGFSIRGGDIAIQGVGLDGSRQNYFDLIARSLSVAGQINAKDLQLVAGANDFNYATRTATAVSASGTAPTISIDSSQLGGMYADRIRLIATENGVGVRLLGDVAASVDDITLNSAGKLQLLGKMSAQRDLSVNYTGAAAADAISITDASIAAKHDLSFNGGAGGLVISGGVLNADNNATITAASVNDTGAVTDVRFAAHQMNVNITNDAAINGTTWNGGGLLQMTLGSLIVGTNGATLSSANNGAATGAVSINTTNDLALSNAQVVTGTTTTLNSTSGTISLGAGGKIQSAGATSINARTSIDNSGEIISHGDLTLASNNATGNLQVNNQSTGTLQSDAAVLITGYGTTPNNAVNLNNVSGATLLGDTFAFNGLALINAGNLQGTSGSAINSNSLQNSGKLIVSNSGTGDGTISANNLINTGTLQSARNLTVTIGASAQNSGSIIAAGDATISFPGLTAASQTLTNDGLIQAGNALSVSGGRIFNVQNGDYDHDKDYGKIIAGTLNVFGGDFANAGTVQAKNGSSIDVATFDNENHLQNALVQLSGSDTGSGTISASDSLYNGSILTSAGTLTITTAALQNGDQVPVNNAQGSIFSQGNLLLHVSDQFDNYGLLLSYGDLTIDGNSELVNHTVYKSDSIPVDSVGQIIDYGINGNLVISANDVRNEGYLEANGGSITINTNNFTNITLAPATVTTPLVDGYNIDGYAIKIGAGGGVIRSSMVFNGLDNSGELVNAQMQLYNQPLRTPPQKDSAGNWIEMIADENGVRFSTLGYNDDGGTVYGPNTKAGNAYSLSWDYVPANTDPNSPNFSIYDTGSTIFRDWTGKVYCCTSYSRAPLVAHTTAYRDININLNGSGLNQGAQLNAGSNITIKDNGRVDYTPGFTNKGLDLQQQTYNAYGRAAYHVPGGWWNWDGLMIEISPINLADVYIVTSGPLSTENVTMVPGVINVPSGHLNITGARFSNSNAAIIASALTTTVPAGRTPGVNGAQAQAPVAPVGSVGLNLTLPTNPNGLYIVSPDPSAKYLIETNPLYGLESTALGSDYLANRLGLGPDQVIQRLGDASYENRLVSEQISAQTGLSLLNNAGDQGQEMQQLMDNAVWVADKMKLSFGIALTPAQINGLQQDILWMVETSVNGHKVLAPVVYLSSATRASIVNGSQIVAGSMAISGADTFDNRNATITVKNKLDVQTSGDINNINGTINAGNVSLKTDSGNINNVTEKIRTGDDDNYVEYSQKNSQINATTGNLKLEATTGNITSIAADMSANGDAALKAGGDITQKELVLEDKTTTHEHHGNWFTGETTVDTVKITQSATGSNLKTGGNVSIDAGNKFELSGSQVDAAKDLDVKAKDVAVKAAEVTDTTTVHASSSGWFSFESGSPTQNVAGVGWKTTTTDTSQVTTRVISSGLKSGGNMKITGQDSVTLTGSNVDAGGNLTVKTISLTTNEATASDTYTSHSSSTQVAIYGTGGLNAGAQGIKGSKTTTDVNNSVTNAIVTTLKSGGDMTLDVAGGSIKHQGTQIDSGGDFTQKASTIDMTAAQNTQSRSEKTDTRGGGVESGAYFNFKDGYDQLRGGNLPSTSAPAAEIKANGFQQSTESNQSATQAVVASIHARGNVNSTSSDVTNMEGTDINSQKNVTLKAKELNYTVAQNSESHSDSSSGAQGNADFGIDMTGSYVGGVGGGYNDSNSSGSSTTAVVGSIKSRGDTRITTTTGDLNLTGTQISAEKEVTIKSGGNVNITAAANTTNTNDSAHDYSGSISSSNKAEGRSVSVSGNASSQDASTTSSTAVVSNISGKNVKIGATTGDVNMEGANVDTERSRGNISVTAGRDINLTAATSTMTSNSSGYDANLSAGGGANKLGKDQKWTDPAGMNASAGGDYNNSSSTDITKTGGSFNGRNIAMTSGRDTSMEGTQVNANGKVAISTGGKLTMRSAQSTTDSSSLAAGGSFGAVQGDENGRGGGGGNIGGNYANSSGSSVKNQNVQVLGNNISIKTGSDMTMEGAIVRGRDVTTVVGGNLIVTSRADTSNSSSMNVSGYLGGGTFGHSGTPGDTLGQQGQVLKSGINGQYGDSSSSSTRVRQQSGIEGSNSTVVIAKGDATLTGAHIGGENDGTSQGVFSARSLTRNDVDQSSSQSGVSFSGGITRDNATTPGVIHSDKPATSSKIQATVGVADMSSVLGEPVVQTALLLNKGLQSAATHYGGPGKIPTAAIKSILKDAGVSVGDNASDAQVKQMALDCIANAQQTVVAQFEAKNVQPAITQTVLDAIGLK